MNATPAEAAPRVYLDYTQAELDRSFDQRAWVPDAEAIIAGWRDAGEQVRAVRHHWRNVPYGLDPDETLDIFFNPGCSNAPVHVHIHGGRWLLFTKDEESFIAPTFMDAGAVFVVPNFSSIARKRLPEMVGQVQRAIAWLHANAGRFGGNGANLHLSGHSSGAHIAAVLLTATWPDHLQRAQAALRSGLLVSGIYDMRPVMLSARSSYVKLAAPEVLALSPLLHIERLAAPVTIVYGERETPEFRRQSAAFAQAAGEAGKTAGLIHLPETNHFAILNGLADAGAVLAKEALRLML